MGDAIRKPRDFQFTQSQEPKPGRWFCVLNNRFRRTDEEAGNCALRLDKTSLYQGKGRKCISWGHWGRRKREPINEFGDENSSGNKWGLGASCSEQGMGSAEPSRKMGETPPPHPTPVCAVFPSLFVQ
jgi:hypothetical protein